jgi:hypothetical protein
MDKDTRSAVRAAALTLRCATRAQIAHWADGPGFDLLRPDNAVTQFCAEAHRPWCQRKREEGRCILSDGEFQRLINMDTNIVK